MSKRRTHSSIDRLPRALKDTLTRMLVDNEWPEDFPANKGFGFQGGTEQASGSPRYEDLVVYCAHKGHKVSLSAVGRFGMRMRTLARMKQAGAITREVMADLSDEQASQTQKAVADMITAVTIEFVSEKENFSATDIRDVAKAMKDCTAIAIHSDKYVREQIEKKAAEADKQITAIAGKKKIDPETLKAIREQVYGIVSA